MASVTDPDLLEYVARLAPQIDRLFIAGHRAAAPLTRELRVELGRPRTVMIDLRKLLLSPTGMTAPQAEALERYQDPREIAATIDQHVREGLLRRHRTGIVPTERGRDLLLKLTDILGRAVDGLWGDGESVSRATEPALTAVQAAQRLPPDRYPAFSAERAGYMPESPSPAMALWSNLATLRYLRADAHALAWHEVGLSVREIQILTALRYNPRPRRVSELWGNHDAEEGPVLAALDALCSRGWVARVGGECELTESGRRVRTAIEVRTNDLNAPPYLAIASLDRDVFLTALQQLQAEVA
jgi:hypothetical protein